MYKHLLLAIYIATMTGCATRSDFSALSSKNVNISNLVLKKQDSLGRVTGKDCKHEIIGIPTKIVPSLEEAIDKAFEVKGGNLLLDATTKHHFFFIPLLYSQECWEVSGDSYDTYKK